MRLQWIFLKTCSSFNVSVREETFPRWPDILESLIWTWFYISKGKKKKKIQNVLLQTQDDGAVLMKTENKFKFPCSLPVWFIIFSPVPHVFYDIWSSYTEWWWPPSGHFAPSSSSSSSSSSYFHSLLLWSTLLQNVMASNPLRPMIEKLWTDW